MNKKQIRKMQTASGGPLQLTPEEQKYLEWSKMTPKQQQTYRINRAKAYFNDGQLWNAAKSYFGGFDPRNPHLITGEAPSPGMIKNPKQIIQGFQGAKKVVDATKKYITLTKESTKMQNYPKIGKRYSESQDIMSDGWPIGDILHLKIPDGTHSSLGIGNYYRAIGNRKGLKSVIENGVVAPKGQFSREGKVFWNDGYLDRNYSGKGIFALSYDKSGKAHFYSGNKPQKTYVYSSNNTPIDFYDEALGLHARIPFTQTYKEIPKTQEGIDYALKLDKINRYIEKPIHKLYNWGLKPYLGYKGYKYIQEEEKTKQHKFKDGGQIQEKQESSKMNILEFLKNGSGIHIKKENRGKFTDYCDGKVTSECIQKGKHSSNPAIRKRATFAANVRKWKHSEGGILKFLQEGGTSPKFLSKEWINSTGNKINKWASSESGQKFISNALTQGLGLLFSPGGSKSSSNMEIANASLEAEAADQKQQAYQNAANNAEQILSQYSDPDNPNANKGIFADYVRTQMANQAIAQIEQNKKNKQAQLAMQQSNGKTDLLQAGIGLVGKAVSNALPKLFSNNKENSSTTKSNISFTPAIQTSPSTGTWNFGVKTSFGTY